MIAQQYIGVDIGGTSIRAARFSDDNYVPIAKTKPPTQATKGVEAVLQRIEAVIREVAGDQLQQIAASAWHCLGRSILTPVCSSKRPICPVGKTCRCRA